MALATVVSYKNPEGNMTTPLGNLRLHRWSLTLDNTNTHPTGLANIVDYALKSTIGANSSGVTSLSAAGVFTFTANGSHTADLLVWSAQ